MAEAAGGGGAAGEVGVCACMVLSYGAVAGGRFCKERTVVVQAGPCQSAACAGAWRQGRWMLVLGWAVDVPVLGGEVVEEWRGVLNTSYKNSKEILDDTPLSLEGIASA